MSKKNLPSWPANLPLPVEYGKMKSLICLSSDQLQKPEELQTLVHDIFWFPDDLYYIFGEVDKGMGAELFECLRQSGICIELTQRCFYPHPNPGYKNDFVQLTPDNIVHDWHRKAAKKQEYVRYTIALAPWKRKELDIAYAAEANVRMLQEREPIVEAKPGVAGFSVNLMVVLERVKRWWRHRRA